MSGTATEGSVRGDVVALRVGPPGMAWSRAHAGARAFSAGADPLNLLSGLAMAGDALAVILAAVVAHLLCHGFAPVPLETSSTTLLATALTVELTRRSGAYSRHIKGSAGAQIGRAVRIWTLVIGLLLALGYVTKSSEVYSRFWVSAWYFGAMFGLVLVRLLVGLQLRRWWRQGRLARTVAVVEADPERESTALTDAILKRGASEVCFLGVFSPQGRRPSDINDLMRLSRLFRIDEVIVTRRASDDESLTPLLRRLGALSANIHVCTSGPSMAFPQQEAAFMFGYPVVTIYRRPLRGSGRLIKRVEDITFASVLFVALLPLLLIIAAAIRVDTPGPVLFRQKRIGFNNNPFQVLKFRTMVHRPEADREVHQARRNDPRVTRIGRVLRRTSLDELPQLVNVLKGDMSLVGPRPHAVPHDEQFAAKIDDYLSRHRAQPGITGWAQVNGLRGETDTLEKMQRRVEHDLAYIDGWSLLLDLKILLRTCLCILDRDAY